jgi:hypothetical protein
MHLVDQNHLDQLSRELSAQASRLIACREAVLAVASLGRWNSPAARVFAVSLQGTLGLLQATSNRVLSTGELISRHGRCASHRERELDAVVSLASPLRALL